MRRLFSALARLKALFVGIGIWCVWMALMGVSDATSQVVYTLVTVIGVAAPFLPLKQLNLDGNAMIVITTVLSLVVAVAAGLYTKELTGSSFNIAHLAETAVYVFGLTQFVFTVFKHNPVGPLKVT